MRRLQGHHRASGQRGYALILVMVGLVTLTILGVTQIQSAQLDMKITQNMRHHKQLQYGALAGQDHARVVMDDVTWDGLAMRRQLAPLAATDGCLEGWISTAAPVAGTPVDIVANSRVLASYSVNICKGVWGSPLPGETAHQGDQRKTYSLDLLATGAVSQMSSSAQAGAFVIGVDNAE